MLSPYLFCFILAITLLTPTLNLTGLKEVVSLDGNLGVEVGKSEGRKSDADTQTGLANLAHVCSGIVHSLCQSSDSVPVVLNYIAFLLNQVARVMYMIRIG